MIVNSILNEDLRLLFHRYFDVHYDVTSTPRLFHEALSLRFEVYCVEHEYENPLEFPDQMERDVYDSRSLHSLLIHRPTLLTAGTVRLICPDRESPLGSLPIDRLCDDPLILDQCVLPRESMAEVSRFSISKGFRRRLEDAPTPTGISSNWTESANRDELRRVPHLSLGLVQAMVSLSAREGITHWVAEMEPALLRMYARLGIHWNNVGPLIQFRGKRQPCYTKLDEMLERTKQERPDVWDLITRGGCCIPPNVFSEAV